MDRRNTHAMVDCETASLAADAAVLTIGIVMFDPMGDGSYDEHYYFKVPPIWNKGRDLSLSTIQWWMDQTDEARKEAWSGSDHMPPPHVSEALVLLERAQHIWANDPDADCTWLKSLFEQ